MATLSSGDQEALSEILQGVTESLDIPDHLHLAAVEKYERVGQWLAEAGSDLREFSPTIYPQGSFRLGTVVKPMGRNGAYDIDLVCLLGIKKTATTQRELKAMVGRRLRLSAEFAALLAECRRCWTLDWSSQFHMDILPAIPNVEALPDGILLTDTDLHLWQKSNPITFSEWFRERMRVRLLEKRAALAKSLGASIEDVPEWRVRTPLQRVVQILKRHRDLSFLGKDNQRPVSIIITTLAAQAYQNQADLVDSLVSIVERMPAYITRLHGRYVVANPVEPDENFADKWNEDPERRDAFFAWMTSLQADIGGLARTELKKSIPILERSFGRTVTGDAVKTAEARIRKSTGGSTPLLGLLPIGAQMLDAPHAQAPRWPPAPQYEAVAQGFVHSRRNGERLSDLDGRRVPKHVSIRFELRTNTPPPFQVFWQVVNRGAEAASANCLRGGFVPSEAGATYRWEDTQYQGTHWVEAFVIKNEKCVARSGRLYVPIG